VFTPVVRASATGTSAVTVLAGDVSRLVYDVNEKAASANGIDIFKMTTRSSKALKSFAVECQNESGFTALVDDLYFLVYEGTGDFNRLPSPPPEFAMDVKFLRTLIRHDLDHGKDAESAKKRKRAGQVFRKYTGKSALGECGPDDLLAAQLRLLTSLKTMLEAL